MVDPLPECLNARGQPCCRGAEKHFQILAFINGRAFKETGIREGECCWVGTTTKSDHAKKNGGVVQCLTSPAATDLCEPAIQTISRNRRHWSNSDNANKACNQPFIAGEASPVCEGLSSHTRAVYKDESADLLQPVGLVSKGQLLLLKEGPSTEMPLFAQLLTVRFGLFTSICPSWYRERRRAAPSLRTRPKASRQSRSSAALQDPQTGRSCLVQRDLARIVCSAGRSGHRKLTLIRRRTV